MDETQTQIAWPSKLKIGAKSKKGDCMLALSSERFRVLVLTFSFSAPVFYPESAFFYLCVTNFPVSQQDLQSVL